MPDEDDGTETGDFSGHRILPGPPADAREAAPGNHGLKVGSRKSEVKSGYGLADVIGKEDRNWIVRTKDHPWHLICSLVGWFAGKPMVLGTGALISPHLVLTAGHCIKRRFERIDVIPGRAGTKEPFGRREVYPRNFRTHPDWATGRQKDRDAGALILDRPFDGIDTWFEIAAPPPETLVGYEVNIAGYPAKSPGNTSTNGDEMWFHSNGIEDATPRKMRYAIDTSAGQSGAPVWAYATEGGAATVIGIHAYGVPNNLFDEVGATNSATRIDDDMAAHIRRWADVRSG